MRVFVILQVYNDSLGFFMTFVTKLDSFNVQTVLNMVIINAFLQHASKPGCPKKPKFADLKTNYKIAKGLRFQSLCVVCLNPGLKIYHVNDENNLQGIRQIGEVKFHLEQAGCSPSRT